MIEKVILRLIALAIPGAMVVFAFFLWSSTFIGMPGSHDACNSEVYIYIVFYSALAVFIICAVNFLAGAYYALTGTEGRNSYRCMLVAVPALAVWLFGVFISGGCPA